MRLRLKKKKKKKHTENRTVDSRFYKLFPAAFSRFNGYRIGISDPRSFEWIVEFIMADNDGIKFYMNLRI